MVHTKVSLYNRFTSITFDKRDSNKSKMQAVMDLLNDAEINENKEEYYSSINITGIFSYEKDTLTENWLLNSVKSLVGSTIDLTSDWVQVIGINKTSK